MTSQQPPQTTEQTDQKKPFELSVTQIAAASLAAVTAAFLGSRLGLAGTVVGAALASVVSTVATAVYSHSLATSAARVHTWRPVVTGAQTTGTTTGTAAAAITRATPTAAATAAADPPGAAGPVDDSAADDTDAAIEHAEHVERLDHSTIRVEHATGATTGATTGVTGTDHTRPDTTSAPAPGSRRRFVVAAGSLAAFVLALVAVTGFEAVRGEPLSGDGGGTTIARVLQEARSGGGDGGSSPQAPADPTTTVPVTSSGEPAPTSEQPGPTGSTTSGTAPTTTPGGTTAPGTTTPRPAPTTGPPTTNSEIPRGGGPIAPTAQPGS